QEHERGERMRGGAVAEAGEKEADEAAQESAPRKHIPSTVARHRCHFTRRTRSKTACQLNPSLVCPISRTTAASRLLEKDRAPFGGESGSHERRSTCQDARHDARRADPALDRRGPPLSGERWAACGRPPARRPRPRDRAHLRAP